jgi:hypothetical protein
MLMSLPATIDADGTVRLLETIFFVAYIVRLSPSLTNRQTVPSLRKAPWVAEFLIALTISYGQRPGYGPDGTLMAWTTSPGFARNGTLDEESLSGANIPFG